jgi:ATP synthase F1 delta subunit
MAVKFSRRLVAENLADLFEQGESVKHVAEMLAAYLLENHQTRQIELFMHSIRSVLAERYNYVSAEVASAHPLTDQLAQDVASFVQRQAKTDQVEIIDVKDPRLVSGVVISTTDAVYDGSLRGKIKKLKAA